MYYLHIQYIYIYIYIYINYMYYIYIYILPKSRSIFLKTIQEFALPLQPRLMAGGRERTEVGLEGSCMYACECVCMCVYAYVCMCVCMHA